MNLRKIKFDLRRFYILIVCIFSVFFSSCTKKPVKIPGDVLSKEEIVPILVDIHLAQAARSVNQASDSARYTIADYTAYILKSHHVSKEKYESSISFYTEHPELLELVYGEVITELSKKQGEAEKK